MAAVRIVTGALRSLCRVVLGALLAVPLPLTAAPGFRVEYQPVTHPEYAEWQQQLRQEQVLEGIAADLNATFRLATEVILTFAECDEENAFYSSEEQQITLCYELLDGMYRNFEAELEDPDEVEDAVMGATAFIFFHELGHALVDIYDLPITGREEDAVDQLATLVLADGTEEGEQSALDGATSFYHDSEEDEGEIDESAFWDEHSMNAQRFYNIVCWVYGHDPELHSDLTEDGVLPEERAEQCEGEWEQLESSWTRLLKPHLQARVAL